MIARDRGEERVHSRWRPSVATGLGVGHRDPEPTEPLDPDLIEPELLAHRPTGSRRWLAVIGVAAVVVMAAIAGHRHHRSTSPAGLPSTPSRWVEQWTAASLDSPARVCQQLFAPALTATFKADTGRSCLTYYGSLTNSSFRIRHVLQDGPTAAVEAQQLGHGRRWGYFTLILSHVRSGWQAVDVVPGGSVRPR
jgi:hypothetical protein